MKRRKSPKPKSRVRDKTQKAPRTAAQYFAKPERVQETLQRVTDAIAQMRKEGVSLRTAAREARTTPRTVTRWAGSAIRKDSNGHYAAKASDQLLRILKVPTPEGVRDIGIRGPRQASVLGSYWSALQKFLATGDYAPLGKFPGKHIKDADGNIFPLLTDRAELRRLGYAGNLSFESLYSRI